MTFKSLSVEVYPDLQSARAALAARDAPPVFCSLDAYRWPLPVERFARDRGLSVHYVDGCWVRVVADSEELGFFLREGWTAQYAAGSSPPIVPKGHWFVIDEEEF